MIKPQQLREFLQARVKSLRHDPGRLQIYLDSGQVICHLDASFNYQYNYTLNLVVTDFAEHPNVVMVPLLAWLKDNQTDLAPDAIKFEADILSTSAVDLSLTFPLTEAVIVNADTGEAKHLGEQKSEDQLKGGPLDSLFVDGEKLANG